MECYDVTLLDLESLHWPAPTPVDSARVVGGDPATSTVVIVESRRGQMGLWRVTPGSFETDHAGYLEFIHVIAGAGRLVSEAGSVTELRAGTTVVMPVGWKGRWEIDAALVKAFTILPSAPAEFTVNALGAPEFPT